MPIIVVVLIAAGLLGGVIRFALTEGGISQMNRAFAALRAGGIDAARAVIDKAQPKPYPERMAALALIGDRATLERDLAALDPSPKTGYTRAAALLGLMLFSDAPDAGALVAHAAAFDRDAPRMWGRIKTNVNGIAAIGAALASRDTTALRKLSPGQLALNQPWLTALLWEASVRAFERAGQADLAANARQHLAHLDRARRAA